MDVSMITGHPMCDALNLIGRVLYVVFMVAILQDLVTAAKYNGPVLHRLIWVFVALTVQVSWLTVATLEELFDFLPGVRLTTSLSKFYWLPVWATVVALWLFMRSLRMKTPFPTGAP
jgi:hypothetical protein